VKNIKINLKSILDVALIKDRKGNTIQENEKLVAGE